LEQPAHNPVSWLVFEPAIGFPAPSPPQPPATTEQPASAEQVGAREIPRFSRLNEAGFEIIRATRSWVQYGTLGFAVFCIVIGAVEALFGR